MKKDPNYPERTIVEWYDPPLKVKHTERDAKAIVYYKFKVYHSTNEFCHLDIYEEDGEPYDYKGGNWYADNCEPIEELKTNKQAARLLSKE